MRTCLALLVALFVAFASPAVASAWPDRYIWEYHLSLHIYHSYGEHADANCGGLYVRSSTHAQRYCTGLRYVPGYAWVYADYTVGVYKSAGTYFWRYVRTTGWLI